MEDSLELDSTVIFKQDAEELTTVQNLEDALARFGFTKDDKISRRELVTIYNHIRREMEPEIFRLANTARYAEAKEMRARLTALRAEFDGLQLNGAASIRTEQQKLFQKGSRELIEKVAGEHSQQLDALERFIEEKSKKHELFQDIETHNLEQKISLIPRPPVRYSKRLIELFKSEYNLNKLKQYDEAIKVRRMIDKLLPLEEKNFYERFDQDIENKRKKLEEQQKTDQMRFEEKLKKTEWNDIRRREKEMNVANQRLKNHAKDMNHTHSLEGKLRAEMSVKPSALWQHREGYGFTSASLRGQQLVDIVRGKKIGTAVYAESLVERHDFVNVPLNTITLSPSKPRLYTEHSEYKDEY